MRPLFSLRDKRVNRNFKSSCEAAQAVKRDGLIVRFPFLYNSFSRPAGIAALLAELTLRQVQCLAAFFD